MVANIMMTQITEETFEQVLQHLLNPPTVIGLKDVAFIDPCGMVGILEIGELLKSKGIRKTLQLPKSEDVLKYLERMDFFRFAEDYFDLEFPNPPAPPFVKAANPLTPPLKNRVLAGFLGQKYLRSNYSDVLLEITPIESSDDIHFIVGKVKDRAKSILAKHLHYDDRTINGFIVALSEVCQNIIEHSENKGFVGIQKYHFNSINKNVVKIAVMDIGIGFRKSLSERFSIEDDMEAIEKALLRGTSRYADEGRGHGLAAVRRFVNQWNGKLSIRSGTARFSIIPAWARGKEKEANLADFPGSQINILLPET
ncbi:MAG: sensor histidine kinase [Planctomycetes bacterium]|nr:sensor histidine kinase [Planctomycetota bacterium]